MKHDWPESYLEDYEHFNIPSGYKNILVLSDVHLPYHSVNALDEAIDYGITKKVDCILLNGDILDCYMLSKFQPDPRMRSFGDEIEAFKHFVGTLKAATGAKIYFKLGNHEERYYKLMLSKAPEFLSVPSFDFENILGCGALGVDVIQDQRIVYAGKLAILHGHEVKMAGVAVNPARTLFLKTYASALCGHLHRTSHHSESNLKNKLISCWSTGHLGDPHPKYAPINKWNHGIARVEVDADGHFEVINIRLRGSKLYRT